MGETRRALQRHARSHVRLGYPELRESFPYDSAPKHLIFDRDTMFSPAVVRFEKAVGTKPTRTAYPSPWQSRVAERWIGSCRRELLAHVVILGKRHLARLKGSYLEYHHKGRIRGYFGYEEIRI